MNGPQFICLALGVLALSDAPLAAQFKGDASGKYGWVGSLTEGKAQAKKSGKPLMVVLRCVP